MVRSKKHNSQTSRALNRRPERVKEILVRLHQAYPDARLILQFRNPFQLLCATILAAQAKDEKINQITPTLFERYPDAATLASANFDDLCQIIRSSGFYRVKARRLIDVAQYLTKEWNGKVPQEVDALASIPGIGRKTAVMVINHAYNIPSGIAVDTHVQRIARRLDWTEETEPDRIERDLLSIIPQDEWIQFQDLLAFHGRKLCRAPKPSCSACPVFDLCYSPEKIMPA